MPPAQLIPRKLRRFSGHRKVDGAGEADAPRGATPPSQFANLGETRTAWMTTIVHATMKPLMRLWHLGVVDSWANLPHAEDVPYSYMPGLGPDRVLILGGHAPASFGVLSHEFGLVGNLSRQVQNITGRGVEIEVCANVSMTLHDLVRRVGKLPPVSSGAVMVLVGLNDALRFASIRQWKKDLSDLNALIRRHTVEEVHVFLVEIPPVDLFRTLGPLPKGIATRHARLLNETTKQFCLHLTSTHFIPFPSVEAKGGPTLHSWTPETYKEWSRELAGPLAEALLRAQATQPQLPESPDRRPAIA